MALPKSTTLMAVLFTLRSSRFFVRENGISYSKEFQDVDLAPSLHSQDFATGCHGMGRLQRVC